MTNDQPRFADEPVTADDVNELEGDEGDILDVQEPTAASRLSPYAIAALVVAGLGLWTSTPSSFPPFSVPPFNGLSWWEIVLTLVPASIPPIATGILALWLAGRAREEIVIADKRLGGVGLYRAAQTVAIVTLAIAAIGVAIAFFGPDIFDFEPPPPDLPAQPVEPEFGELEVPP